MTEPGRANAYVEVKNVHSIREPRLAEFPDTVTKRGAKHLDELASMAMAGDRAIMLYVIQRDDCDALRLCADLDPGYVAASTAPLAAASKHTQFVAASSRLKLSRLTWLQWTNCGWVRYER